MEQAEDAEEGGASLSSFSNTLEKHFEFWPKYGPFKRLITSHQTVADSHSLAINNQVHHQTAAYQRLVTALSAAQRP